MIQMSFKNKLIAKSSTLYILQIFIMNYLLFIDLSEMEF